MPRSTATAVDVLDADGYLLGTPANLGYMSGALKHFFDQIYYPCLERRPSAARTASSSTATTTPTGALRAIDTITTGLRWQLPKRRCR